jgi:hypothetical protein
MTSRNTPKLTSPSSTTAASGPAFLAPLPSRPTAPASRNTTLRLLRHGSATSVMASTMAVPRTLVSASSRSPARPHSTLSAGALLSEALWSSPRVLSPVRLPRSTSSGILRRMRLSNVSFLDTVESAVLRDGVLTVLIGRSGSA